MAAYTATIAWQRLAEEVFTDFKFHRGHDWRFDAGVTVRGTSSPHVVPRYSDSSGVDPEEAFVASLASCHMLTFLYFAARKGFVVDRYEDSAEGEMAKNDKGKTYVKTVKLRPRIAWAGQAPDAATLAALHRSAHEECYIANTVLTEITIEP
jgi:organic hydroperoxide reductase OsmC/OhrA